MHPQSTISLATEKRIRARIADPVSPDGCALWIGRRRPDGYGEVVDRGRRYRAHRAVWEIANGPIPDGWFVCHRCDTPPCCRLHHLFIAAPGENAHDTRLKGRARNQYLPPAPRLFQPLPKRPLGRPSEPPAKCAVPGCVRSAAGRGWCGTHYMRWLRHGSVDADRPDDGERLWAAVDSSSDPDGCWPCRCHRDKNGYGQIRQNGRPVPIHRAVYEAVHGPIPVGMCIAHRCDNPPCCNPTHLFLATNRENTADKMAKGRHRAMHGEQQGSAILTADQVREIRRRYALGDVTLEQLGIEYGTSFQNVSLIVRGKSWRHLL